jgi:hypothetical protein
MYTFVAIIGCVALSQGAEGQHVRQPRELLADGAACINTVKGQVALPPQDSEASKVAHNLLSTLILKQRKSSYWNK